MNRAQLAARLSTVTGFAILAAGSLADSAGHHQWALPAQVAAGALIVPVVVAGVWRETSPHQHAEPAAPAAVTGPPPRLALPAAPPRAELVAAARPARARSHPRKDPCR